MCGIVGYFIHGGRDDKRTLARMTDTLRHRGPDDEGLYLDHEIALGVRRLSIIDIAMGSQPIGNEDDTVHVVHNGEIYNHGELREQLTQAGHRFRTQSDTEVLVHAWEEYGEDCVQHLDGMFAFAVWDSRRSQLFLARDRMGEKPLYYHVGASTFVFGSELRAFLAHPDVTRRLDLASLSRYLAFEYVPSPHSILEGIEKLPPGHVLTARPGREPRLARYWDLRFAPDARVSEEEWATRLRAQLGRTVRERLVSDVPVGMFLSGGVDSSIVVALAEEASDKPLKTFSVGFAEGSYDERRYARLVARHCGTEHHEIVFGAADVRTLLEHFGGLLDEPLVDGSYLPLYALSRLAKGSVDVVLSGDGGDELFCGYPTFLAEPAAAWLDRLPAVSRRAFTGFVNRLPTSRRYGSVEFLLKQFTRSLPYPPAVRTQVLLGGLTMSERTALLSPVVRAAVQCVDVYEDLIASVASLPMAPVDRLIYQHCAWYLGNQNLVAVDRASMACGLEVRSPFLAQGIVELSATIPSDLKLRGWTTKYILKRAFRDVIPHEILSRRKQGFGVPLGPWLRGPLRDVLADRLDRERIRHVGLFDPGAVERLVAEHVAGTRDHHKALWSLLAFDAWREHYLVGQRWSG